MKHNNNIEKKTELTQIEKQLDGLNQIKVPGAKDKAIYQSMQVKLQERGIIIGSVEYIDAGPTESSYGLYMGYTNKRGETKRAEFDICSRKLGKISNILWSWGASISPGEIEAAISHTIKNMEGSVRARRHTHLGFGTYHGEPIFKMDDSWDAAGNKISTYGSNIMFTQAGNLNDYMMGLKELVVGQPALLTTLVAGASGLVCQALNIPDSNIIVNLHGDTSIGKSTAENLALAFWGDSRTLMTNFNSTPGFWNTELKHRNIDCCGGSAKVCINIDQSGYTFENKIYNDIDYGMACLIAVAQSPEETKKMIEYLKELGTGKEVFEYCQKNRENHDMDMFKVAAFNFFVTQCSYDATGKFYNSNRVTEEVYQRDIEKAYRFPEITSGIKVINNTYQDIFRVYGSDKQALKYMDPPYHPATRETTNVYNYEMSRDQHKEMVDILCNSRCWILSGYDPAEYGCDDYKPLEEAGAIKLSLGKYALTSGSRRRDEILHKDEIIWLKD